MTTKQTRDRTNGLNADYAKFGVLVDLTGIGMPGIPVIVATNGPRVNNRFERLAPPIRMFGGFRITL